MEAFLALYFSFTDSNGNSVTSLNINEAGNQDLLMTTKHPFYISNTPNGDIYNGKINLNGDGTYNSGISSTDNQYYCLLIIPLTLIIMIHYIIFVQDILVMRASFSVFDPLLNYQHPNLNLNPQPEPSEQNKIAILIYITLIIQIK